MDGGQLLEREGVLGAIAGLLDGLRAGRGGALFVVAEAGLGKTTCLVKATSMATAGVQVGWASGDVMETAVPFGPFTTALAAVGYRDLLDIPLAATGFPDVRAARFYGVLRWLGDTADPVLLAMDDLHWADPDSLALLSFLCRRLAGLPVAVLGTLRPWPPTAHELAAAMAYDGHAQVQRLAPLSGGAAATLLAARVGGPVSEAVSRSAAGLCAGNPLLLEQVAVTLCQRGHAEALARLDAGIGAEGIVLTRFAGLPPAALRVARAASVIGTTFRPALATAVAGLDDQQAEVALLALCHSGLVCAEVQTAARFVHPLFCQSLYHDLAPPVRARLHARAFTVLCTQGLETEAAEHAIRADLVGDQAAITVVEQAGRLALATGAPDTAIRHLRAATRLAGDRPSPALLLALGEALLIGGQPGEAIEVNERLRAQPDLDITVRVQTLLMLGRALFAATAHNQATQRFSEAATLAEACSETTVAEVLLSDAALSWLTLGPTHALPLAQRACELTRSAPAPLRRQALGAWGFVAFLAGDPAGLVASEAVARELMSGSADMAEICWGFGPLGTFAIAAVLAERFADAEDALGAILTAAARTGATQVTATHLIIKVVLAIRQGRLTDALAVVDQVSVWAELMPFYEGAVCYARAEILLLMGQLTECAQWCDRLEKTAIAGGPADLFVRLWHVRAQLLQHAGQLTDACALYERIEQLTTRMGLAEPCAVPWARHALLCYLAANRIDDCHRVLGWIERDTARLPCHWPRIVAATGWAGLAEARGDVDAAERHYQTALALHEQVELPVEHIETLLGYGSFLRRRGQPVRGRAYLAEALVIAEKCEATGLAEQAHAELTIAGGRRRQTRGDPARLTAQEQRVARLAAAGHSNKAIAGQLSLSAKTIEHHLAQVYTKLGINSRRQLMTGHYNL